MPTECAYCKDKQFKLEEDYAKHILKKHSEDAIRSVWAREVLGLSEKPESPEEEETPEEEPKDDIGIILAAVLRPEVLERMRGCEAPVEKPKKKKEKPKESTEATAEKPKRSFHWPLIVTLGVIILILLFALCRLAY